MSECPLFSLPFPFNCVQEFPTFFHFHAFLKLFGPAKNVTVFKDLLKNDYGISADECSLNNGADCYFSAGDEVHLRLVAARLRPMLCRLVNSCGSACMATASSAESVHPWLDLTRIFSSQMRTNYHIRVCSTPKSRGHFNRHGESLAEVYIRGICRV